MVFEYIAGGAGDEVTLRANRESFDRIRLRPRFLVDVSSIDTRITIFGQELASPFLLAPCAYLKLIHPDGECESVRGANLAGTTLMASTSSTTSVEEMAEASGSAVVSVVLAKRSGIYAGPVKPGGSRWLQGALHYRGCAGTRDTGSGYRCLFKMPPGMGGRTCKFESGGRSGERASGGVESIV
ncbi:MAG: alpha-hydroxy acid oxidase [Bryobacteraceae bacterium]